MPVGEAEPTKALHRKLMGAAARCCVNPADEGAADYGVIGVEQIYSCGGSEVIKRTVENPILAATMPWAAWLSEESWEHRAS